jgi:hypothetical protein
MTDDELQAEIRELGRLKFDKAATPQEEKRYRDVLDESDRRGVAASFLTRSLLQPGLQVPIAPPPPPAERGFAQPPPLPKGAPKPAAPVPKDAQDRAELAERVAAKLTMPDPLIDAGQNLGLRSTLQRNFERARRDYDDILAEYPTATRTDEQQQDIDDVRENLWHMKEEAAVAAVKAQVQNKIRIALGNIEEQRRDLQNRILEAIADPARDPAALGPQLQELERANQFLEEARSAVLDEMNAAVNYARAHVHLQRTESSRLTTMQQRQAAAREKEERRVRAAEAAYNTKEKLGLLGLGGSEEPEMPQFLTQAGSESRVAPARPTAFAAPRREHLRDDGLPADIGSVFDGAPQATKDKFMRDLAAAPQAAQTAFDQLRASKRGNDTLTPKYLIEAASYHLQKAKSYKDKGKDFKSWLDQLPKPKAVEPEQQVRLPSPEDLDVAPAAVPPGLEPFKDITGPIPKSKAKQDEEALYDEMEHVFALKQQQRQRQAAQKSGRPIPIAPRNPRIEELQREIAQRLGRGGAIPNARDMERIRDITDEIRMRSYLDVPDEQIAEMNLDQLRRMAAAIEENLGKPLSDELLTQSKDVLQKVLAQIETTVSTSPLAVLNDKSRYQRGHPLHNTGEADLAVTEVNDLGNVYRRIEAAQAAEKAKGKGADPYLIEQYRVTLAHIEQELQDRAEFEDPEKSSYAKATQEALRRFAVGKEPLLEMSNIDLAHAVPMLARMTDVELTKADKDEPRLKLIGETMGRINAELERRMQRPITNPTLAALGTRQRLEDDMRWFNTLSAEERQQYLQDSLADVARLSPDQIREQLGEKQNEIGVWDEYKDQLQDVTRQITEAFMEQWEQRNERMEQMDRTQAEINAQIQRVRDMAARGHPFLEEQLDPYRNLLSAFIIGALPRIARTLRLDRIPGASTIGTAIGRLMIPTLAAHNAPLPMMLAAMNLPVLTPDRIASIQATVALPFAIRKFKRQAAEFIQRVKRRLLPD